MWKDKSFASHTYGWDPTGHTFYLRSKGGPFIGIVFCCVLVFVRSSEPMWCNALSSDQIHPTLFTFSWVNSVNSVSLKYKDSNLEKKEMNTYLLVRLFISWTRPVVLSAVGSASSCCLFDYSRCLCLKGNKLWRNKDPTTQNTAEIYAQ